MKMCRKCRAEKSLISFETSRATCRACRSAYKRTFRTGDYMRRRRLDYNYGMTLEHFREMSKAQDDKCYLCKEPNKPNRLRPHTDLVVDHDHKTGKIRKLLCDRCNRGIGQFNDNIELMYLAIDYLKEHSDWCEVKNDYNNS